MTFTASPAAEDVQAEASGSGTGDAVPMNVFAELDIPFYQRELARAGIRCHPFEGARARRDVAAERSAGARYLEAQPASHRAETRGMAGAIPPLSPQCRMTVLIPCRFEQRRLGACLDALRQACSSSAWGRLEIVVLENWREGEQPDATGEVIGAFRRVHPGGAPVHHLRKVFAPQDARMGLSLSRKLLADVAVERLVQRSGADAPLYLASMDADVVGIEPGTLEAVIARMDADGSIDAVRGVQDRQPEILAQNALLLLERRSWFFAEKLLSDPRFWPHRNPEANFIWHRNVTGGWNTFFSAQVYAEIGGYSRLRFLEDVDIGNRISV